MHPDDGRVVSNFICQALRNQDLSIFGDGSQTRSFCYAKDLIDACVRLMEITDDEFTGPVNLGNPTEFTIGQLAETVIEMTGSKSKIQYAPLPSDDPRRRRPDISLAREKLGWEPKTPLREGLKHTIEYFDDLMQERSAT